MRDPIIRSGRCPEVTYNNIYYPHIWPQIALLYDYLFSDVFTRSRGQIEFPPRYAQGYAYLQSKVYGDRPGRFFGDEDVRLWMPAQLLAIDDEQVNYVTAFGADRFYIALLNESARPVKTTVRVTSPASTAGDRSYAARKWTSGGAPQPVTIPGSGVFPVEIAPRGLTALAIEGVRVQPQFQQKFFGGDRRPLGPGSYGGEAGLERGQGQHPLLRR